jgi:peptidoglycan/xylan/chitin deacetylase (PgdA/CDA1 family)
MPIFLSSRNDQVLILLYHKIDRIRNPKYRDLFVSPEAFEKQIAFLHARDYSFLTAKDLIDFIETDRSFPIKNVFVTFDDGYLDAFNNALPVLQRYKAKGTIFLTTEFIGKNMKWNEQENFFLGPELIYEMEKQGIDFGSHSLTHPSLPSISPEEIQAEVSESKSKLEALLNHSVDIFSYPFGSYNETIKKVVLESGYKCACSLHRGINTKVTDPFALRRMKPSNSFLQFLLLIHIAPFIEQARKIKRT